MIRIGTDIVKVSRMAFFMEKPERLKRIFSSNEISQCLKKARPRESFGARFAAKEAFFKALGSGVSNQGIHFLDVEILNDETGRPVCYPSEKIKSRFSIQASDVSLSHEQEYAISSILLVLS